MRRRDLMLLLGSAMTIARPVAAQQKAMPVIGYLSLASPGSNAPNVDAFRQGLRDTGYVEGQNVVIEYRWAEGRHDELPALAADLVGRKVDVIMTSGGTASALAAKNATSTIPIVFTGGDPVAAGLVASLARPGGNLSGLTFMTTELLPKQLELLSDLVPEARTLAMLVNPNDPLTERFIAEVQEAARAKGLLVHILNARTENEIDAAFVTLVQLHAGALLLGGDLFFFGRREQLVALAARHAVPAIYERREFAEAGGLISYGPSFTAVARRAGAYVGRILAGAKPAELPVQQPTTFELVINLKTAKALGLAIPRLCSPAPTRSSNETANSNFVSGLDGARDAGIRARFRQGLASRYIDTADEHEQPRIPDLLLGGVSRARQARLRRRRQPCCRNTGWHARQAARARA
jgi:putative ABC transport system substrate-binding protein